MELYKKYRPKKLKTIIGNKTTVTTLSNMFDRKKLPHCILFHGPSGCGKTTFARVLKRMLKCSEMDFKELNCSSSRGIDTIREIERTMNLAPTGGKVRIWLLDEAHKMTNEAQNAALKILEDTPSHVYFILCTTEPHKLISTVRNRCTPFAVELLSEDHMKKVVDRVLKKEKDVLDDDIIEDLIDHADGSARKALVILDQILNMPVGERKTCVFEEEVPKEVVELCQALLKGAPWKKVANILKGLTADPETIRYSVLGWSRAVLLNSGNKQAAFIIMAFQDNFYDSKAAGLAVACYEIINGVE